MSLDFPSTPSNNQIYFDTDTGSQYRYEEQNGYWKAVSNSTLGISTVSEVSENYTLSLSDSGVLILMNATTNKTITIPANSSVAFPIGTRIDLMRFGTGNVNVAITTDTLRSSENAKNLKSQYSVAGLIKVKNTQWVLVGDIGQI